MFFLPNSIKFIMDRPVEKMHVKEPERINSEGRPVAGAGAGGLEPPQKFSDLN